MQYPIENVFKDLPGYNCFACGPYHPTGLKLSFSYDDESNEVFTVISPDSLFAGFPGILHGGIQATILDETAFWGTFARHGRSGFTYDLRLRYRKKCPMDQPIEARGIIGELNHHLVVSQVSLREPGSGLIYTDGEVRYYLPEDDPRITR